MIQIFILLFVLLCFQLHFNKFYSSFMFVFSFLQSEGKHQSKFLKNIFYSSLVELQFLILLDGINWLFFGQGRAFIKYYNLVSSYFVAVRTCIKKMFYGESLAQIPRWFEMEFRTCFTTYIQCYNFLGLFKLFLFLSISQLI